MRARIYKKIKTRTDNEKHINEYISYIVKIYEKLIDSSNKIYFLILSITSMIVIGYFLSIPALNLFSLELNTQAVIQYSSYVLSVFYIYLNFHIEKLVLTLEELREYTWAKKNHVELKLIQKQPKLINTGILGLITTISLNTILAYFSSIKSIEHISKKYSNSLFDRFSFLAIKSYIILKKIVQFTLMFVITFIVFLTPGIIIIYLSYIEFEILNDLNASLFGCLFLVIVSSSSIVILFSYIKNYFYLYLDLKYDLCIPRKINNIKLKFKVLGMISDFNDLRKLIY